MTNNNSDSYQSIMNLPVKNKIVVNFGVKR